MDNFTAKSFDKSDLASSSVLPDHWPSKFTWYAPAGYSDKRGETTAAEHPVGAYESANEQISTSRTSGNADSGSVNQDCAARHCETSAPLETSKPVAVRSWSMSRAAESPESLGATNADGEELAYLDEHMTCILQDQHLLRKVVQINPFKLNSDHEVARAWENIATTVDHHTKDYRGIKLFLSGENAEKRFVTLMHAYHDYLSGGNHPQYQSIQANYNRTRMDTLAGYHLVENTE